MSSWRANEKTVIKQNEKQNKDDDVKVCEFFSFRITCIKSKSGSGEFKKSEGCS